MSTVVLCVGKMKEKPYRQMADEYLKRLSRFGRYEEAETLLEREAYLGATFYDSPTRTKRSAVNAYERYLVENPDSPHAEEAKARLSELKEGSR